MNSAAHTSPTPDTRKETILQALDDIADIMNIGKLEGIERAIITPEGKVESWDFFEKVHSQQSKGNPEEKRAYILHRVGQMPVLILYHEDDIPEELRENYAVESLSNIIESFPAIREKIGIIHREEQRYRQETWITPDTGAKVQAILS